MDRLLFTHVDIVIFVTIFQSMIFLLITLAAPSRMKAAGVALAALFVLHVINPIGHFFGETVTALKVGQIVPGPLLLWVDGAYWLAGPLFLIYARDLLRKAPLESRRLRMLLAPGVGYLIVITAIVAGRGSTWDAAADTPYPLLAVISSAVRSLFHLTLAALVLREFSVAGAGRHKNDARAASRQRAGMQGFFVGFTFLFFWDAVGSIARCLEALHWITRPELTGVLGIAVLIIHIGAMLFLNYRCFTGLVLEPRERPAAGGAKYGATDIKALEEYMRERKPYLEPNINLERLAQALGMSSKNLSGLINSEYGKTFIEYINEHRIDEAKVRLSHCRADKPVSVTELIYECGFNSKATFNRSFKNIVGKTPTEYRDSLKSPV